MTTELPSHPLLVGRKEALRDLRSATVHAAAGSGCLVVIAGEPGIGKTRLAQHVTADAVRIGMRALWGTCWEGDGAPAFWPWIQVLRAHGAGRDAATLQAELGSEAGEVGRLVPELTGDAGYSDLRTASSGSRFRLYDGVSAGGTWTVWCAPPQPTQWPMRPSSMFSRCCASRRACSVHASRWPRCAGTSSRTACPTSRRPG